MMRARRRGDSAIRRFGRQSRDRGRLLRTQTKRCLGRRRTHRRARLHGCTGRDDDACLSVVEKRAASRARGGVPGSRASAILAAAAVADGKGPERRNRSDEPARMPVAFTDRSGFDGERDA
ncbi:hypothetical protein C6Q09_05980 [Burkholderia multivorans]|nr:hypothetical protein C6Q09_05980 [Burkholderia multivorans]